MNLYNFVQIGPQLLNYAVHRRTHSSRAHTGGNENILLRCWRSYLQCTFVIFSPTLKFQKNIDRLYCECVLRCSHNNLIIIVLKATSSRPIFSQWKRNNLKGPIPRVSIRLIHADTLQRKSYCRPTPEKYFIATSVATLIFIVRLQAVSFNMSTIQIHDNCTRRLYSPMLRLNSCHENFNSVILTTTDSRFQKITIHINTDKYRLNQTLIIIL